MRRYTDLRNLLHLESDERNYHRSRHVIVVNCTKVSSSIFTTLNIFAVVFVPVAFFLQYVDSDARIVGAGQLTPAESEINSPNPEG
jgi:hypothetical protein